MENENNLNYKIHCELILVSDNITSDKVSELMEIEPYRAYNKGESFQSKKSGTKGKRHNSLWAIKTEPIMTEEEDISSHVLYFKTLLENKIEKIKKLKVDPKNEISSWIWIETNAGGAGFEIPETDLKFINDISNRLSVSIVANENI